MALINGIHHVDGIRRITLAVAHLYDEHIIHRHLVACHHVPSLHQDAIHPVFLARHILRRTEFEAHGRELRHRLSERTVVDDIGDSDAWGMVGVDGDINHMTRLHRLAKGRCLFQHHVGRQRAHIARIRHHDLQASILQNALSVGYLFISYVGHPDGLAMMRIEVDAKLDTDAQQHQHQEHGGEIAPEILALKLTYKLRRSHSYSIFRAKIGIIEDNTK